VNGALSHALGLFLIEVILDDGFLLSHAEVGGIIVKGSVEVNDSTQFEKVVIEFELLELLFCWLEEIYVLLILVFLVGHQGMLDYLSCFGDRCSFLPLISNHNIIVSELILAVRVDVGIENRETVNIADGGGYFAQSLNLLLIGNALLKDSLALALQPPEHEEHELFQIFYLQLGVLA
jgi:hypothetical protein